MVDSEVFRMKAYGLAYSASGIWLVVVCVWLSDYDWYQALSVGTWGFLTVEAITMLPVLLSLFLAELSAKASEKSARNG
ncbi:hypothetical protein [Cohnella sp.]|uniref:hypothetical protein n=1 Tax=Cohnella sp. TaxID=1883426 RepID=UPI003566BAAC